jgi:hypothetical protein
MDMISKFKQVLSWIEKNIAIICNWVTEAAEEFEML